MNVHVGVCGEGISQSLKVIEVCWRVALMLMDELVDSETLN